MAELQLESPLNMDTKSIDVDIKLLHKEQTNTGKEDSSLDPTLPTSCDSNSGDADSLEDSLGPPAPTAMEASESRRVSFTNVEVRGKQVDDYCWRSNVNSPGISSFLRNCLATTVFPRCLGDNPSVSEGPPLALGLKPCHVFTQNVDEYEKKRDEEIIEILAEFYTKRGRTPPVESAHSTSPRRRRKPFEFNIPCRERIMLLHWECSPTNEEAQAAGTVCTGADIKRVIRESQKTKRQRQTTKALREFEDAQMTMERCQRKVKKMWKSKRRSKMESELEQWANASSKSFRGQSGCRGLGSEIKSILKAGTGVSDVDAIAV